MNSYLKKIVAGFAGIGLAALAGPALAALNVFATVPDRWALWHWRCPLITEFVGALPPVRGEVRTVHFFDPSELLAEDARSELRPEHRMRQRGGGWCAR